MGFLDLFRRKTGEGVSVGQDLDRLFGGYFSNSAAGVPVNQVTVLHDSTVLACVQILASDVAKLPLNLFRRLPNGNKILVKDHPVARIFKNPNDYQTRYEWIEHMLVNTLISGNSYSVILRDLKGDPRAVVPINASQVSIYESPVDSRYFYNVGRTSLHETALLRDTPVRVPSEDVLHIKWMSYIDSLYGTNRAFLLRDTVGLSLALEHSAARLVGNGARPSSVIEMESTISKEALERYVASWQETQGGTNRNGGTAFLMPGMKYNPISWSSVDMEFTAQRAFGIEQISRAFRVPLYKLSLAESQPGSSLLQLDQEYLNSTLSSWCDRITARIYKTFEIDEDLYSVEFDYDHFLKADLNTRINTLRVGILGGLYTINEARAAIGLPGVGEEGDKILQPSNVMPLGTQLDQGPGGGEPGSDNTGKPGDGGDGSGNTDNNPDDVAPSI